MNKTLQLYEYHKWASRRVFTHIKELPEVVYGRKIKSVFSSVQEVLVHIYHVDGMWLSVMSRDSIQETKKVIERLEKKTKNQNPESMERLYQELYAEYQSFFDEQEDLDKLITIEHPNYGKIETPVSDLIKHVVNHGTYHRGNITAMLRQQGHPGVPTDYIFYLHATM